MKCEVRKNITLQNISCMWLCHKDKDAVFKYPNGEHYIAQSEAVIKVHFQERLDDNEMKNIWDRFWEFYENGLENYTSKGVKYALEAK